GAPFSIGMRWQVTLDEGLVATLRGLGIPSVEFSNAAYTTKVVDGATGPDVIGTPADRTIPVGAGAITLHEGPFAGTFTRTAAAGTPITFAPGAVHISAKPTGFPTAFNLAC